MDRRLVSAVIVAMVAVACGSPTASRGDSVPSTRWSALREPALEAITFAPAALAARFFAWRTFTVCAPGFTVMKL